MKPYLYRRFHLYLIVLCCGVLCFLANCKKDSPPSVASVTISPTSFTIEKGQSSQLTATLKDATGSILSDRSVAWSTSNPTIATVSSSGLVTGAIPGNIIITASSEGKSGTAQATIIPIPIASLTITPSVSTIEMGANLQLSATLKDAMGIILFDRSISWSSTNLAIATVSASGIITAISMGTITITATVEGKSISSIITVIPATVAKVVVTPLNSTINVGDSLQFTAETQDSRGVKLLGRKVFWSSSDSTLATVSQSGLVKGIWPGSPVFVTAISEGIKGTVQLTTQFYGQLNRMFQYLPNYISDAITFNQSLLINNQKWATLIQAKIEMLQSPNLVNEIRDGRCYSTSSIISSDKHKISIAVIYPKESMHNNQIQTYFQQAIPFLEEIMDTPLPCDSYDIWYGFYSTHSNSGCLIRFIDLETDILTGYTPPLPEFAFYHELTHTYIGNEALTNFPAVYAYNMIHTKSSDVSTWNTFFCNKNLIDIFRLIGQEGMKKALKKICSLKPPYGSNLPAECKQAFVDQAPDNLKAQVAALIAPL